MRELDFSGFLCTSPFCVFSGYSVILSDQVVPIFYKNSENFDNKETVENTPSGETLKNNEIGKPAITADVPIFSPDMIEGIIAELSKDKYYVHPDHSRGIGTTSNQYFITVLKAGAENRFDELKEKLQKYSFEYVNANRRGFLFSRDIKGDDQQ